MLARIEATRRAISVPYGRELRPCPCPLDQNDPDLFFQLLDLHRQGWLRHGALLGGTPEMQRLSERVEIAKLTQRDIRHQCILSHLQITRTELIRLSL